jgi:A/G-specific adenine glycosylase
MHDHLEKEEFSHRLLRWHSENPSSYPWRETTDPYKILVAELLLRKTTRRQVSQLFPKFFAKYPDMQSLAKASVSEIRKLITPLGMERKRAPAMKEVAKELLKLGGVPLNKDQLRNLPAVGEYVANAVLCFVAGQDLPLVDTNVVRVVQRVFSIESSRKRPRTDRLIWDFARSLIPLGLGGEFNVSLLDFAAAVCTPRAPKCMTCPLNDICDCYTK